jgi:predicted lipoprotein with Yx(FWY)xxD motif
MREADMFGRTLAIGAGASIVALLGAVPLTAAAASAPSPSRVGAVVDLENGPYGEVLVVGGSGAGAHHPAGSSLYFASVDPPAFSSNRHYQPGCGTKVVASGQGVLSCTGSENDRMADWPALTTKGQPVAGPGVSQSLLSTVHRSDLNADQVTYAGHPLYLFDPGPNSFFGANFYETVQPLPPWHTSWYLVSPSGTPATSAAALETEAPQPGSHYQQTKLAVEMLPGIAPGGVAVSTYTFSGDQAGFSECYGPCAIDFIPVYTDGAPMAGSGVNAGALGVISRFDGTKQVTYHGHPLYIYSKERPLPGKHGPSTTGTTGNGKGVSAFGGTFDLVNP